jgi:hypothetical protein
MTTIMCHNPAIAVVLLLNYLILHKETNLKKYDAHSLYHEQFSRI